MEFLQTRMKLAGFRMPTGLLLFFFFCMTVRRATDASQAEKDLLTELFETRNYSPLVRPVANERDVLQVEFNIELRRIVEVDSQHELLHFQVYYETIWTDADLTWNASEYDGITQLNLPNDDVWKPDIVLMNSAKADKDEDKTFLMVNSDGRVVYAPIYIETSYCPIDIRWYPFDDQVCHMRYGSWSYDRTKLNLTSPSPKVKTSSYRRNSAWKLVDTFVRPMPYENNTSYEPFAELLVDIHLRRESLYYEVNLVMPYTLVALLTIMVYFLPPDTGDRIGLGITIVLSLSVFQLIVADQVPPTSDGVPLVGIFFGSVMITSTLSLAVTIVVNYLHYRSSNPEKENETACACAKNLIRVVRPNKKEASNSHQHHQNQTVQQHSLEDCPSAKKAVSETGNGSHPTASSAAAKWRRAAILVDRLGFWACAVTLIGSSCGMIVFCLYHN